MKFGKHKKEWLLLIISIVFSMASMFFDIQTVDDTIWFQRSGAVLVLFAAIVEYRLASYSHDEVFDAIKVTAKKRAVMPNISDNDLVNGLVKSNIASKPETPKDRKVLKLFAHVFVVLGTAIWGYGDLLVV